MKRKLPTGSLRSQFMRRSYAQYRRLTDDAKPRPLPFSLEELRAWFWPQVEAGMIDAYTGNRLTMVAVTFDHRIPIRRGGSLHLDNLCLCSELENRGKADLTDEEWLFLKRGISTMSETAQRSIYKRLRMRPAQLQRLMLDKTRAKSQPKASVKDDRPEAQLF